MIRILVAALVLISAGCTGYTHYGYYEGTEAPGWRRVVDEGTVFFYPPSKMRLYGFVSFHAVKKGQIFMAVYFPQHSVTYAVKALRIVPHDGGEPYLVSLSAPRIIVEGTLDFTVEFPSISIDGVPMQPVVSRLTWTDRKYRIHPPPS